jgi:hypothetical protein
MSTNTKCSLQKLSFQFSLTRDALEVLPQVKHLDKAVLTQLCLSWVLIILQPGTLEAEACSYGKGLPATRFFLLLHGLQSLYKSIPPHDCYKRGNGLSVNFLSQCCLHDAAESEFAQVHIGRPVSRVCANFLEKAVPKWRCSRVGPKCHGSCRH